MDGQRFDAWTRALARGWRRRDTIKALVGVALAGSVMPSVVQEAKACEHFEGVCRKRDDCCVKQGLACINRVCLTCFPDGENCQTNPGWGTQCCEGSKCDDRTLKCTKDPDAKCESTSGCKKKKKGRKKKR
jgi:hypothetical protein